MNVLIVDDNKIAADLLAELLADDHTVRTAYSAAEALKAANEECFDVALLDIKLPDQPGDSLAHQLKGLFPALAMIAITGSSPDELRERAGAGVGFAHVLQKPIHFDQLAGILSDQSRDA